MRFCKGCGDGKDWCNGRGKQGKDALSVCAQGLCKDAKPTKHTQTLALRKILCDSANAKQIKYTQILALRKAVVIVWMRNKQSVH